MTGDNLRAATGELARIATRVAALAAARSSAASSFGQLAALITTIEQRTARMLKSVGGVAMLAMNAKVAVAQIDDKTLELASFAGEITRTLTIAQASLDRFGAEVTSVGRQLRAALASQAALDNRQEAAVRAIPLRLGKSVAAIGERGRQAAATAEAVRQGSLRVGQRIGEAIMALQIADATRQRVEHVDAALGLLCAPEAPTESIGFFRRLQAAQLRDAADRFDPEIRRILTSLRDLAGGARDILRLGRAAFGATGDRQGSFVGELEEEVGAVDQLLAGFHAARQEADAVAAAVSQATTRLAAHIGTVRSLETDIRIMGLNMSFKCGRLGAAGRPLSIIAQELRRYAKEIAGEAGAVMGDLSRIIAIADALSGGAQDGQAADIAAVGDSMATSLSCLRIAGQTLADALAALERDGSQVVALLDETVARAGEHDDISRVLRQAAADLDSGVADGAAASVEASPAVDALLDEMMRSYTMESERMLLRRHAPWMSDAAPEGVTADLEDVFF
jgi:hypothetical protein